MRSENNGTLRIAMLAHTVYVFDPRVRREAEALAQQGFEVHVVALTEEGFATQPHQKVAIINGVHVHRLPIQKKRGNSLRYLFEYLMTGLLGALKLAALHMSGKLTVVHVHNMPDFLILSAAIPRLGGSRLVLDIHDPMPELYISSHESAPSKWMVKVLRLQEKVSCSLADRVISVNESMRENLRDKGVSDDKIFIVHNFPDQRVFPICDAPSSWPRNPNCLSLLYCGTITQHYDLGMVVRAVARLAGEMKIKLKIVGGGAGLAGVAELARNAGVSDSVELIGTLPLEKVHEEMRNADVGISCQRGSVFGDLCFSTKIVEYLTQGLPVVSPQTRTVAKYLPGDCLFYHQPGDDAAVAETLRFMWRNPSEVLRRLTRARQLLPHLSWQAEKERFLAFYADLVQDPTRSRSQAAAATTNGSARGDILSIGKIDASKRLNEIQKETNLMDVQYLDQQDSLLQKSTGRVQKWVEAHNYQAYEPFDGLSTSLRRLTFGNHFLDRVLLQLVRQSPINLRPLLGVKPQPSTKGRGYMAWGYLALFQLNGNSEFKEKAIACLEWLSRNKSPLYPDHSWANHFDFASRSGGYSKHESIIVWTALIGQAFLDGFELLGEERYLEIARSACSWILKLPRETTNTGTCLSYLAASMIAIHNSNMLGAALLARTAKHTGESELLDVALAAMEYSCSRQRADGSWYYGESSKQHWIDNFHTGYNLDSLKCYIESTGDETFRPQLDRGFRYFKTTFFDDSGRPGYYNNRPYPIDIQCAAQEIETFAHFSDYHPDALPMALRVADWTIEHMQDSAGYFYYRKYPLVTAKTPMLHWGQATMFRALALLRLKLAHQSVARSAADSARAGYLATESASR